MISAELHKATVAATVVSSEVAVEAAANSNGADKQAGSAGGRKRRANS